MQQLHLEKGGGLIFDGWPIFGRLWYTMHVTDLPHLKCQLSSLSHTFLLSQPFLHHLLQTTPKENLVLAVEAMELHPELWQHYFDDFLQHKLQLECLHSGGVSQQVLHKLFQQPHKQEAISRVVSLHCYSHTYHVDLAKMAYLLQPLNQIQQVGGCSEVLRVWVCACVHCIT